MAEGRNDWPRKEQRGLCREDLYLPGVACWGVVRLVPKIPGVPDDGAGLRAANARLRALLAERDAEIAVLRGQVAELGVLRARAAEPLAEAAGLQAQVAGLTARVGRMNSQKSSKPPSSDGPGRPAPTMALPDSPDPGGRHVPSCCAGCGESLAGAAETRMERWQVTEIPPARAEVTEHQLIEVRSGDFRPGRRRGPRSAPRGPRRSR